MHSKFRQHSSEPPRYLRAYSNGSQLPATRPVQWTPGEAIRRCVRRTNNDTSICPVDFTVKNGIVLYTETLFAQFFITRGFVPPEVRLQQYGLFRLYLHPRYGIIHLLLAPKMQRCTYLIGVAEQPTNPSCDLRTALQKTSSHNSPSNQVDVRSYQQERTPGRTLRSSGPPCRGGRRAAGLTELSGVRTMDRSPRSRIARSLWRSGLLPRRPSPVR